MALIPFPPPLNINRPGRPVRFALLGGLMAAILGANLRAADEASAKAPMPATVATPAPMGPPLALPFTEDFESGEIRKDIWAPQESGGATVTLVQGKGGYGKYVMLAHLPPAARRAYAFIAIGRLPEAMRTHAFGRAYMYITPGGPPQHTVFTYSGSASWPSANWLEVGMYHGAFQLSYQQQDRSLPQAGRGETVDFGNPIPLGRWFCLEWEVNDQPDTLTVWVDGEQMNSRVFDFKTFGHTDLVKGFVEFGIGLRTFGQVPDGYDVYFDNITYDSKRIGPLKTPPAPMPAGP